MSKSDNLTNSYDDAWQAYQSARERCAELYARFMHEPVLNAINYRDALKEEHRLYLRITLIRGQK